MVKSKWTFCLSLYKSSFQFCMAAPTKNQKIESLVKLVQKKCRGAGLSVPPQRTVLETLMYAALLENATFDKADVAYTVLENYYIDWNEIRVCSIRELADTLTDLPHPEAAAERIRNALQGIFEKTYLFDLENLRKKGKALVEHIKTLESMSAGSPYMIQYTAQIALDSHLIPLDESSLRIMRRLGLSQLSNDGTQEICIGLERVVLKKSGPTFAAQLHHFAAGYYDVPDSPELLSQLSAIDPDAVSRSWTLPILATPSSPLTQPTIPAAVSTPSPVECANKTKTVSKKTPVGKLTKPAQSSVKPASKTAPKKSSAKPTKKPVKKPLSVKSATKVKKTPSKALNASKVARNKTVLNNKPFPPKKKATAKKIPVKPVKKPKTVSPSKSLRRKKPK